MASRRGSVTFVAVLLIVAACTNGQSQSAQPTTPPDAFASTPTIGGVPTTTLAPTTTVDGERVALQRVDPVSLEPMSAFEPIPMGDWMWGAKVSTDGRYLAATVNHDVGNTELRLVDLQSWLPAASLPGSDGLIIDVDESGSVSYVTYQSPAQVRVASVDGTEKTVASLSNDFSVWGGAAAEWGVVLWGTKPADRAAEQVFIVTVDAVVTEFPLPEVHVGSVDPVSQGPWAPYLYTSPSFTWDPVADRLLVVHGDEDIVSEVNVNTGETVEHPVAGTTDLTSGTRRMSALSQDGQQLFLSTRSVELIEDDDDWSVITTPAGLEIIDTTTWDTMAQSTEPVSDFWISPTGDGLVASGYTTEESETVYLSQSTGVYLLDPSDLSIRVHYPPERDDQWWGPVTFSEAGSIAYVSTWLDKPLVHALELTSGEILSTVESTETLEMIGSVGVLASNR
jgi:hypothetical protein